MPFEDKHAEVDLKLYKELAKFGYTPLTLRQSFNKKIFLLGLDADCTVLSTEELMLKEKNFVDEVQRALMLKQKPKLDGKKLAEFKTQVEEVEGQVLALTGKAKQLILQIRGEFEDRQSFDFKRH